MRKLTQQYRHNPAAGVYGDCYRTALSVILGCNPTDLPHDRGQHCLYDAPLAAAGVKRITVMFAASSVAQALAIPSRVFPGAPFILGGTSGEGAHHAVVGLDGEIFCDPSQTNEGIAGPLDNGFYLAEWLMGGRA